MPGEVRRDQLGEIRGARGRHDHINRAHELVPLLNRQRAQAIGIHIVDGGNEAGCPEGVGPVEFPLLDELVVAIRSREVVERRAGFRGQDDAHCVVRKIRQIDWNQIDPEPLEHIERGVVELLCRVQCPLGVARVRLRCVERGLDVSDAQRLRRELRIPVIWRRNDAVVLTVGAVDRIEHDRAIFNAPAEGAELVHRPRERHRAGAGDPAESRPEPGNPAARRGGGDRSERLASNREADEPRGRRRRGTGGRSARALIHLPRVLRRGAEPDVTLGELAKCQLRDEHGSCRVEPLHDGGVGVNHLLLEWAGAPRRLVTADGEKIFRAPRNSVQRPAVVAAPNLGVGGLGLP